jgi:hypothetical protein
MMASTASVVCIRRHKRHVLRIWDALGFHNSSSERLIDRHPGPFVSGAIDESPARGIEFLC